jgi:hypothetical protein
MIFFKKIGFTFLLTFGIFSLYSQSFSKIEIEKIAPVLFDGNWNDADKEVTWKPNFEEDNIKYFFTDTNGVCHTRLDTLVYFNKRHSFNDDKVEKCALLFFVTENGYLHPYSRGEPVLDIKLSIALLEWHSSNNEWTIDKFNKDINIPPYVGKAIDVKILNLGNCDLLQVTNHRGTYGRGGFSEDWVSTTEQHETLINISDNFSYMLSFISLGSKELQGSEVITYKYGGKIKVNAKEHTFTIAKYGENYNEQTKKPFKMNKIHTYKIESNEDGRLYMDKIGNQ